MWKRRLLNHPLTWVNGGALVACWVFGAYHAWREHSSDAALMAALLPPYGIYMTAEYEWRHKHEVDSIMKDAGDGMSHAQICLDDVETFRSSGLSREQYEIWCDCSTQMIAANATPEENAYNEKYRRSSARFKRQIERARQSCYATVKYLAVPVDDAKGAVARPK